MNHELRNIKTTLRNYLKRYPANRLAALLAHAQEGKLSYSSCCCFIGVETADHALMAVDEYGDGTSFHYFHAKRLPGAQEAEVAFRRLAMVGGCYDTDCRDDGLRRRRIVPLIRAEFRRRDREVAQVATVVEVAHVR